MPEMTEDVIRESLTILGSLDKSAYNTATQFNALFRALQEAGVPDEDLFAACGL